MHPTLGTDRRLLPPFNKVAPEVTTVATETGQSFVVDIGEWKRQDRVYVRVYHVTGGTATHVTTLIPESGETEVSYTTTSADETPDNIRFEVFGVKNEFEPEETVTIVTLPDEDPVVPSGSAPFPDSIDIGAGVTWTMIDPDTTGRKTNVVVTQASIDTALTGFTPADWVLKAYRGTAAPSTVSLATVTDVGATWEWTSTGVSPYGTPNQVALCWEHATNGDFGPFFATAALDVVPEENEPVEFPADLDNEDWDAVEATALSPGGRRTLSVDSSVTYPAGFVIRMYSGTSSSGVLTAASTLEIPTPGTPVNTSEGGALATGTVCYNRPAWYRSSDGAMQWAAPTTDIISFTIEGSGGTETGERRSSIEQYGVTVTFNQVNSLYPICGQYDGPGSDWWILSPCSVASITPASERRNDLSRSIIRGTAPGTFTTDSTKMGRQIHGTMRDPGVGANKYGHPDAANRAGGIPQGYDELTSTISGNTQFFNAALNVDPGYTGVPITFAAGTSGSFVKAISLTGASGTGAWNEQGRPTLRDLVVFTVVSSEPASGAIRPPTSRTNKTPVGLMSDLDLSIFPSFPLPSTAPSPTAVLSRLVRLHDMRVGNCTLQNTFARNNQDNPGREYSGLMGHAALLMCCNISATDKRNLAEAIAVQGSEVYGAHLDGRMWVSDGQLNYGRKLPLVLTALMLDHTDMLVKADGSNTANWLSCWKNFGDWRNRTQPRFAEDNSTYYINAERVSTPCVANSNNKDPNPIQYEAGDIGNPEWEINRAWNPDAGNNKNGTAYRNNVIWGMYGAAMACHLITGARQAWNYPAFFDYCDFKQSWAFAQASHPNYVSPFTKSMWNSYRNANFIDYDAASNNTFNVGANLTQTGGKTAPIIGHKVVTATTGRIYLGTITNGPFTDNVAIAASSGGGAATANGASARLTGALFT